MDDEFIPRALIEDEVGQSRRRTIKRSITTSP